MPAPERRHPLSQSGDFLPKVASALPTSSQEVSALQSPGSAHSSSASFASSSAFLLCDLRVLLVKPDPCLRPQPQCSRCSLWNPSPALGANFRQPTHIRQKNFRN